MTTKSLISKCCKVRLWLRNLAGMVVWHEENGRKIVDAMCPECNKECHVDLGKVPKW